MCEWNLPQFRETETGQARMRGLLIAVLCLCLSTCDGGFRVRGNITGPNRVVPQMCRIELNGPPEALTCCNGPVSLPRIDVPFTVAPSRIRYKLVLTCDGFNPLERDFTYRIDTSPTKPLDLGVVTLLPSDR
jgi:hypothetical protein